MLAITLEVPLFKGSSFTDLMSSMDRLSFTPPRLKRLLQSILGLSLIPPRRQLLTKREAVCHFLSLLATGTDCDS